MYRRKYYLWMKKRWFFPSLPFSVFLRSFKRHDSYLITLIFDIGILHFNSFPGDSNVRSIWNNQYCDNYYIITLQSFQLDQTDRWLNSFVYSLYHTTAKLLKQFIFNGESEAAMWQPWRLAEKDGAISDLIMEREDTLTSKHTVFSSWKVLLGNVQFHKSYMAWGFRKHEQPALHKEIFKTLQV